MKIFVVFLLTEFFIFSAYTQKIRSRIIYISTADQLKTAVENARAGDEIILRDGIYKGNFKIPSGVNGTENKQIFLHGSSKAILDGRTTQTGYVLHMQSDYWHVKGITITNGLKGIMCDNANYNVIDSVSIFNIGEEGLHLRQIIHT